jgi:hypothetical protein
MGSGKALINDYLDILTDTLEKAKKELPDKDFELLVVTVHKIINYLLKKGDI